jgi:hypothetical protein
LIACANCWRPAAKLKAFNRKVREERPLRTETYPVGEPYKDGFVCDLRDLFAIFAVKGFAFLCFGKAKAYNRKVRKEHPPRTQT